MVLMGAVGLLVTALATAAPAPPSPGVNLLGTVFAPGDANMSCFRIPSVVQTSKGTLVAFAEARHGSCSDGAVHEIATARSVDGGKSWSKVGVAVGGNDYYVGNPDAVATASGKIVLVYVKHSPKCAGDCGTGNGMVVSVDDGVTFGPPADVSKGFGRASGSLPGPGVALQSSTGRILVVSHHGAYQEDFVTISDDDGGTWRTINQTFPAMDEAQITQLPNGSLMLNMRHTSSKTLGRGVAFSMDDGETWTAISYEKQLVSPVCQASTVTFGNVTYFSNPHTSSGRQLTTVQSSVDNGNTWQNPILIQAAPSAGYTCLVKGSVNGAGGILYEGLVGGTIDFATFPLTK